MNIFCAICSQVIPQYLPRELLSKNIKDIVDDLNITLIDEAMNGDRYLCQGCFAHVNSAFDFKCTCLYSEDLLHPYINKDNTKINLKDVYKREVQMLDDDNMDEVCRLCLKLLKRNSLIPLENIPERPVYLELLKKYIPQVNLDAIASPVICLKCLCQLKVFGSFKKYPITKDGKEDDEDEKMETDELESPKVDNEVITDEEEINICNRVLGKFKFAILCTDKAPPDESNISDSHLNPLDYPKNAVGPRVLQCVSCGFRTMAPFRAKQHSKKHEKYSVLKCVDCHYRTKHKNKFETHEKLHTISCPFKLPCLLCRGLSPADFKKHCCKRCKLKTSDEKQEMIGVLTEENIACTKCPDEFYHAECASAHETEHLLDLRCKWCPLSLESEKAKAQHINPTLLKCDLCQNVSKCKTLYQKHMKVHSQNIWCDDCNKVVRHPLLHTIDFDEIGLHRCQICKSKVRCSGKLYKDKSVDHGLKRCKNCTYKSRSLRHSKRHTEIHETDGDISNDSGIPS